MECSLSYMSHTKNNVDKHLLLRHVFFFFIQNKYREKRKKNYLPG